jgi:hypothetical protein
MVVGDLHVTRIRRSTTLVAFMPLFAEGETWLVQCPRMKIESDLNATGVPKTDYIPLCDLHGHMLWQTAVCCLAV